jgi:LPXTG-site transpeptidase (sortase) family protein
LSFLPASAGASNPHTQTDLSEERTSVLFSPPRATIGQWSSLGAGSGLNATVVEIISNGGVLYAGGDLLNAGGDPEADRIAKFSSGAWTALAGLGSGLDETVLDIEFSGGVLYASGDFTDAGGDPNADRIAKFSAGVWSSLGGPGTGLSGSVYDIEINAGVLYAGGTFLDAGGDPNADAIAMFSGGAWTSLNGVGSGLNNQVKDFEFSGGVIYAGGAFTNAGGDADADFIAKFNGGAWSSLGGPGTGLNNNVWDIELSGGVIYAGGEFTDAGADTDADLVAKFTSGVWSSLGGLGTGLNGAFVFDIELSGGVLYAGGSFTDAGGDPDADHIARFNGGAWSSLGGTVTGLDNWVFEIEISGDILYAGGDFVNAGGDVDADRIAQFGLTATSSSSSAASAGRQACNKEISSAGTSNIGCGRIRVSVPASAILDSETDCRVVIKEVGDSESYGFELNDTVWDVKIICDRGEVNVFFAPITVCIRPKDGVTSDKTMFHNHGGGFVPIYGGTGPSGYVCGSTQALSLFTLSQFGLPDTGFALGQVSQLSEQPAGSAYTAYDGLTLEIPQLNVSMQIWGVPQTENGWDVSWLGANAGYLNGTAFPTWAGNSVLTAHVWTANNTAGPFYHLKDLKYGDQFYIYSGGQIFAYEVRSNRLVSENNLSVMNTSDFSLVTLITCEAFDEGSGGYLYRRAVQAVLVSVD